ncbi:MAG: dienelactone hydrolase family protein [Lautropia sp.]
MSMIELTATDGHRLAAWKAEPTGKAKGAVVIVQEIFGVNSHIRAVADAYAAKGYLAIAPAFFDRLERGYETGYEAADIAAGREMIAKLAWKDAMTDLAAGIDAAKAGGKVAVIGYCWGGTIAWLASTRATDATCGVAYYGGGIPNFVDEAPARPLLLHFGEKDTHPSPEVGREVARRYPSATEVHVYEAGHGFNCDQRGSYDAAASSLALERTLAFLDKHL